MLYIPNNPIQVQLFPNNRALVVNSNSLYFTHTYYMQKYLTANLVGQYPLRTYYSQTSSQVLILTKTTVEIYYSDWISITQLRKILILNNQQVLSAQYDLKWKIYGKIYQYSQPSIQIIKIWSTFSNLYSFVGNHQFAIIDKKLYKIVHLPTKTYKSQITWKQRLMVLSNCKENLSIVCMQNTQNKVLCIGQNYVLLIDGNKVVKTLQRNHIFYFENNLIVSGIKDFKVDRIYNGHIDQLGITQSPSGLLYAAVICQDQLIFMHYQSCQLIPKCFKLIITQLPNKKSLQQSFDSKCIPQQANESGSIFINPRQIRQSTKQIKQQASILDQHLQEQYQGMKISQHSQNSLNSPHKIGQQAIIPISPTAQQDLIQAFRQQQSIQIVVDKFSSMKQSLEKMKLSQLHDVSTPQFLQISSIMHQDGDMWAQYNNKWKNQEEHPIAFSKTDYPSEKVRIFSMGRQITQQLTYQIEQKKYYQLLLYVYQHYPKHFQQYLYKFLLQLLQQQQSHLLFLQIRIFNPQQSKLFLSKLFSRISLNQVACHKILKILRDYKLNQVPFNCLPYSKNILDIIFVFNPQTQLNDLLDVSVKLISDLLEIYLQKDTPQIQQIHIQDQVLDISHPRNILSALLYLNQTFQIPHNQLFITYITKLLRFGHISVVNNLLNKQNVLEICQVPPQLVDLAIQDFIFQVLRQSCAKLDYIYDVISVLKGNLKKTLQNIYYIIEYFNKYDLVFSVDRLFMLKQNKNISTFVSDLIVQNSPKNLVSIDLGVIYKKLYQLYDQEELEFYNYELVYLIQILSQKLLESEYVHKAFQILDPLSPVLRRGFITKLLMHYFQGKLVNRLIRQSLELTPLKSLFPQIFAYEHIRARDIVYDPPQIPTSSEYYSCSWSIFQNIADQILILDAQVTKIIIYVDLPFALELIQYDILHNQDLQQLLSRTKQYMKKKRPQLADNPSPYTMTNIPLVKQDTTIQPTLEEYTNLLRRVQPKMTKSMTNIINRQQQKSSEQQYAKSVKDQSIQKSDTQLGYLRVLVQQEAIMAMLRQIYQNNPRQMFVQALSIVQKQRIKLYHCQTYKLLVATNIKFQFQKIIPFEVFTTQNLGQCYLLIKDTIQREITFQNFWVIYLIINILFGQGNTVVQILIKKIVLSQTPDQYSQIVEYIKQNSLIDPQQLQKITSNSKRTSPRKLLKKAHHL